MQPFKVLRWSALALLVLFCIVPAVRGRSWAVYVRRGAASEGAAAQANSASGMLDFYGQHTSVGQWAARSLRQIPTAQPPREAPSTSQNPQKVVCDTSADCVEHYESMFLWCTPEKVCNACGGPGGPCCTEELGDYPYTTPCVDGSGCLANTSRCAGDAEPGVPCRTNEDCAELPKTFCNTDVNYCNACDAAEDPPEVCRSDGRSSLEDDWPAERIAAVVTPVVLALFLVLLAVVCVGKRFQAQHRKDKHALSRAAAAAAAATAAAQGDDFQVLSAASPPSYVTSSRGTAERLLPEALPTPSATASSPASELGPSSLGAAAMGGGAAAAHPPAQRAEGDGQAAGQEGAGDGAASRPAGGDGGGGAEGRDGGSAAKPTAGPLPWRPDTGLRLEEVEMGSPSSVPPVGSPALQPERPPLHPPSISQAHSSHAAQQPTLAEKLQEVQESAAADSTPLSSSGAGSGSVERVDGSLATERQVAVASASAPANGQAAGHADSSSQASSGHNAYDARLEGLMVMARLMPPLPDVDMNVDPQTDLSFQRVIGRGAYGVVYEGFWTARDGSRRHVAIKTLKPSAMAGGERQKMLDSLQREIDIMTRIDHKGIVRCYGGCIRDNMVCVLLEMMNGGTLSTYVHQVRARTQPLSVREVLSAALQLSSALAHLHPLVVHADIKPLNLLLDHEGTLKVADFGLSKYKYNTMLTSLHGGTLAYTAPEVLANAQVNEKCDIYSLGMVLWECLASELPWSQIQIHFQIYHEVVNCKNRPQIPAHCPRKLKSIIESCWHHDPVQRPSAFEVYRQAEVLLASLPADE